MNTHCQVCGGESISPVCEYCTEYRRQELEETGRNDSIINQFHEGMRIGREEYNHAQVGKM